MSKLSAVGFTLLHCAAGLGLVAVLLRPGTSTGWLLYAVGTMGSPK
jgi:hypothetical protein